MAGSSVIGALRVNLGIDTAAFSNGLAKAQTGLKRFGAMAKVGLMAAAAAAGALSLALKGTINAADDMSKAAQKIGVPIEELSRLKYAADLSGVSFEQLQTSVGKLSRNMADALEKPTGEAAGAFARLGIAVTGSDGKLRSSSDVMKDLADRFAAMPDGAEKTAAAMEIMGRAGAGMIPLLNGGSEALGKLMGEADQFGQVFTKEMGANAELFNDNISRLQGAFGMLTARLAGALLPHLAKFTDWLVANAPAITDFIVKVVEFGAAIVQLGADIYNLVTGAWASFEAAWNRVIELRNQLVEQMKGLADDLVAAMAEIPARMVEIGGQIIDGLWQGIQAKWEEVKVYVTEIGTSIKDTFKSVLGIQSPSTVMRDIGVNIMEGLANGMASMAGGVAGGAGGIAGEIEGAFQGIGASIAGLIDKSKSWRDVIKDVLKSIAQITLGQMRGAGGLAGFLAPIFGGLLGFANGGQFNVGGSGGVDSQLVAFKASPNETVTVTKPGQQRGGGVADVRVFVDRDGNWHAAVERIAQGPAARAAAHVAKAVPSIAQKTSDDRWRKLRPQTA